MEAKQECPNTDCQFKSIWSAHCYQCGASDNEAGRDDVINKRLDRPELREKLRELLLAPSLRGLDDWNGLCVTGCGHLLSEEKWKTCRFKATCQDTLIHLILALKPTPEEIEKQERGKVIAEIAALALKSGDTNLKGYAVGLMQAIKIKILKEKGAL